MQTCSVNITLGGNLGSQTIVPSITPAEALMLMRIHGREHVVSLDNTLSEYDKDPNFLLQQLAICYGGDVVEAVFGKQLYNVKLPETFEEIRFDVKDDSFLDVPAPKTKSKKAKAVVDSPVVDSVDSAPEELVSEEQSE